MADSVATVSARTLEDLGGWRVAGRCTVAFSANDYPSGGVPIANGLEKDLGIVELEMAEPAFDDATASTTWVLTVDDTNVKFRLWDIAAGVEEAATVPAGLSYTLRYIGRRRT